MKKRALINLIGVFIVVALVITAWVLFPNKVRIGYYKQLDANGQFYKIDNNNEKRVYIYDKNKKEHMEEWYIKTGEENYIVSVYDKDIKSVDDDILDRLKKEVNSIEFEEYYITYNSFNDNGRLYEVYFSINFKSEDKENVISQNKKKSLFDKIRSWLYE